jgi:hypothetical protein
MKRNGGYIIPITCGFSITVAKIQTAKGLKLSGVNCRGGPTGVFQVSPERKLMCRFALINFGDGPTVPVRTSLFGVSVRLTDNIVHAGVNYKFS